MIQCISHVVANRLCTSCGTCAGVCATGALEMVETPAGLVIPKLAADLCSECGLCDSVCPQMNVPAKMEEHLASPYVGPIHGAYLSGSSAPAVAAQGQTGGLARSLLAFSLESGLAVF